MATGPVAPALPAAHVSLSGRGLLLLAGFTLSLYLFALGSSRTYTGHECFVAEPAREMLATGDWLVPRVAGYPWLEKPPLPHWTVAAVGGLLGGVTEGTARLPSALAALAGVLLLAQLAAHWYGRARGLLVGFIHATTFALVTYARLAEADVYLWLLVTAALTVYARAQVVPPAAQGWHTSPLVFWLLIGLTQLAKGPLFGAVLVLLPCAGLVALRRGAGFRWLASPGGIALAAAVAVAWPAAVLLRHPEALDLWRLHTVGRLGDGALNPRPWWYYLSTVPWQIGPWTLAALLGAGPALRRAWHDRTGPDRFLALWFFLPLLALSAVRAKHHHYLIHALPPCSFWAAEGLIGFRAWLADRGFGLGALARRPAAAFAAVLALCWAGYGYLHAVVFPRSDRYAAETVFLRRLNGPAFAGKRILVYAYDPSRVLLYCRRPVELYPVLADLQARMAELADPVVLTSVGQARQIAGLGEFACLDEAATDRWDQLGAFTRLAVYRVTWKPPAALDGIRPVGHTTGDQAARP